MASVPEQPTYDPGVYQYEVTDPVLGGVGGIANAPLTNLANRTNYLKQRLDALINGSIIPPTVAPLNGPAFTGSTTAPNVAAGDDSNLIANTDFVQTAKHGLVVVTCSGGATVTLTQPQWGCAMISFVGVLTANISVVFPAKPGNWIVSNGCTGTIGGIPCTITCRLASGIGGSVVLQQFPNQFNAIWTDGVGVFPQISPFLLALTLPLVLGALGYTPVQQGGGTNQSTNKVYIGYDHAQNGHVRLQVDTTDFGDMAMQSDVTFEANTRANQDGVVALAAQNALNAEISTRFANDNSEITTRFNADQAEITARFNGDQAVTAYVNTNFPPFSAFPFSATGNGFDILPNGRIFQWGATLVTVDNAPHAITVNTTFPNAFFNVLAGCGAFTPLAGAMVGAQPVNNSQFDVTIASSTGIGQQLGIWWMAIGR